MPETIKDSLTLKASRGRLGMLFCVALVFLIIALVAFPPTPFYWCLRLIMVPACLLGMLVFATGIMTNKYDAILSKDGIDYGTFVGRKRFAWCEIRGVHVINAVSGKEVCLVLNNQSAPDGSKTQPALRRLPDTYGMDPDEFAKTLVRWQHEYGNLQNN